MKKALFLLFTVLSLVLVYFYVGEETYDIIVNGGVVNLLISLLFAFCLQALSGVEYVVLFKSANLKIGAKDALFLPPVVSLWGLLIPFQGSLIFSTFFFKHRYDIGYLKSFSLNIYFYLLSLSFSGVLLFFFSLYFDVFSLTLLIISLGLVFNPLILYIGFLIFIKIGANSTNSLIGKLHSFSVDFTENVRYLWEKKLNTLYLFIIKIIYVVLYVFWVYFIATFLGFDFDIVDSTLIVITLNISQALKLTPANIGVNQLVSGVSMAMLGESAENTVLLTLYITFTVVLISLIFGFWGNYVLLNEISIGKIMSKYKLKKT